MKNKLVECKVCGKMNGKFRCVKCGKTVCGTCINRMTRLCKRCEDHSNKDHFGF